MPSIDERLQAHAAELDRTAPWPSSAAIAERRPPRRPRALLIAVAAVVVSLLAAGVVQWQKDDQAVVATPPATSTTTQEGPVGTLPADEPVAGVPYEAPLPPTEPPEGWLDVNFGGIRMFAPPPWTVQEGTCPGRANTITLGAAPPSIDCGELPRDRAWIWITPAEALVNQSTSCVTGSHNGIPGCMVLEMAPTANMTLFVDGLDVVIVTNRVRGAATSGIDDIVRTWQYSDLSRPEASRPSGPDTTDGYEQEQPLSVASGFVLALAQGRCDAARELTRMPELACDPAVGRADATVNEAGLTGLGGAVESQTARVVVEPGSRAFELRMQTEWSLEDRQAHWKVIEVTEV